MPEDKYYAQAKHKEWARKVKRRALGLCEECKRYGRRDKDGNPIQADVAHHVKPKNEYPELRYDLNNGRALCKDCHNKAHPEKGGKRW